jgi:hypothetical protein
LPWLLEEFDAIVLVTDETILTPELAQTIADRLVNLNNDWIEVLGKKSEFLHDLIDEASVAAGRQGYVGEGLPMTGWDDEATPTSMLATVERGGHGGNNYKLIVIVADDLGFREWLDRIKSRFG